VTVEQAATVAVRALAEMPGLGALVGMALVVAVTLVVQGVALLLLRGMGIRRPRT